MLNVYGALVCSLYYRMLQDEALYSFSVNFCVNCCGSTLEYAKEIYCSLIVTHTHICMHLEQGISGSAQTIAIGLSCRGMVPEFQVQDGISNHANFSCLNLCIRQVDMCKTSFQA